MEGARDARGRLLADARARALTHPTRRRVLDELAVSGARTIPELADALGVERANLYHHVAALAAAGLVDSSGRGRMRAYGLAPGSGPARPAPAPAVPPASTATPGPASRSIRIECDAATLIDVVRALRERFEVDERAGALRVARRPSTPEPGEETDGAGG